MEEVKSEIEEISAENAYSHPNNIEHLPESHLKPCLKHNKVEIHPDCIYSSERWYNEETNTECDSMTYEYGCNSSYQFGSDFATTNCKIKSEHNSESNIKNGDTGLTTVSDKTSESDLYTSITWNFKEQDKVIASGVKVELNDIDSSVNYQEYLNKELDVNDELKVMTSDYVEFDQRTVQKMEPLDVKCGTEGNEIIDSNKVIKEDKAVECQFCKYRLASESYRRKHETRCPKRNMQQESNNSEKTNSKSKRKKYVCEECSYTTSHCDTFRNHYTIVHSKQSPAIHFCSSCSYTTVRKRNLICHQRRHDEVKKYLCKYCSKSFTQKLMLDSHVFQKHKDEITDIDKVLTYKVYSCEFCLYETVVPRCFTNHMVRLHKAMDAPTFKCDKCDYECYKKALLIQHSSTHSDVKPLACAFCDRRFNKKLQLDSHMLTKHKYEKTNLTEVISYKIIKCEFCPYQTMYSRSLSQHVTASHGSLEAPKFKCDKCEYRNCLKRNLKQHIQLRHSDDKSFVCEGCNLGFNRKDSLDSHIVSKHKDNEDLMNVVSNKIEYCPECSYFCIGVSRLQKHTQSHK